MVHTIRADNSCCTVHIPKYKLCGASDFFRLAFTSDFREGEEQTMDFPDEDVDIFDMFLEWLYKKSITDFLPIHDFTARHLTQSIDLYNLADKFQVLNLKSKRNDVLLAASLTTQKKHDNSLMPTKMHTTLIGHS